MKKLLSTILASALTLSFCPAFAQNNTDEMQKILLSVKERIGSTDEYEDFVSDSYTDENDLVTYTFDWSTSGEDSWTDLSVRCDENGIITSYYKYTYNNNYDNKLSINRKKSSEVIGIAENIVKKLNPDIAANLKLENNSRFEDFRSDGYTFNIMRYENGIPVTSDTGSITLDSDCNLSNFHINYNIDCTFQNSSPLLSEAAVKDKYNSGIGLELVYTTYYDDEPSVKLVYRPPYENNYIHAVTGEVVNIPDYYEAFMGARGTAEEKAMANDAASGFTAPEEENIETVEGLLSKEEVDKLLRNNEYLGITSEYTLKYSTLNSFNNLKDNKFYQYVFSYQKGDNETAHVCVDAKTGEITYFSNWSSDYVYDEGTADKETAEKILKAFAGDKASEYRADKPSLTPGRNIHFTRYINDIPFDENTAYLEFNKEGRLIYYNISYDEYDFPAPQNLLSKDAAFDKMKNASDYRVIFMPDYKSKQFIPVYSFAAYTCIDAVTGEDIYKDIIDDESYGKYTDISGHYAESKIKALAEYGICFEGTELHPDAPITEKEYTALLSVVFSYNSVSLLRNLADSKLYYPFNRSSIAASDEPLTRKKAAKIMLNFLGIEEYAELSGIYAPLYNDVTEDIGYINILTGLKVLSGDGSGNFFPDKELTRAQGLIMIYNYLTR